MKAAIILLLAITIAFGQIADERVVVLEVLKGVVEGISAQAEINLDVVFECVHDTETVIKDLNEAFELLKSNELNKVKEGIKKIGEAIQVLPDALTECQQGVEDAIQLAHMITSLLEQLRHPIKFAFTVGKNLIVNRADIYKEVVVAVNDWQTQQYEDYGKQVGAILYQLLATMSLDELEQFQNSDNIVATVFEGVLEGFLYQGGVHIEDIKACITESETVVNDFIGAVQDFSKQTEKSVLEGLKLLGEGLQTLPDAITNCLKAEQEAVALAAKLVNAISSLRSPKTFAFHVGKDLIVNGRDIYKEVRIINPLFVKTKQAVLDWNSQDYHDFGFQCGEILYQLFVGVEQVSE